MNDLSAPSQDVVTVGRPTMPETEATQLQLVAQGFTITDDDTAQMAVEEIRAIKDKLQTVEDERQKIVKPLNEAVKAVNALFKKLSVPLEAASTIYRSKLLAYSEEQERKRREAQAKADEAARVEKERLEKEAAKLEKKGKVEEAAAKREVADMMPTSMPAAPATKIEGFGTRKNWKHRLKNKRDVIVFVAANPAFDYLLDVNEQKADQLAKQHEAADLGVPGIEGYNAAVASIR